MPIFDISHQQHLQSVSHHQLLVSLAFIMFGRRTFSIASPTVWNSLKGKEKKSIYIALFLAKVVHSTRSGMDHTELPANNTMPAFPS